MNSTANDGSDVVTSAGRRRAAQPGRPARPREDATARGHEAGPAPERGTDEPGLYAIGQAARELGVSVRALRYYQEVGLLTPSGRTSGGNRLYGEADLARVRRIRELQQLMGFNLDEIRVMLGHEDRLARVRLDYRASSDTAERARLLDAGEDAYTQLRDEINEKISRLEAFRDEMDDHLERVARARARLSE